MRQAVKRYYLNRHRPSQGALSRQWLLYLKLCHNLDENAATTMPKPHVVIYTDGGAKPNPGGPGGWAAILIYGSARKEMSGGEPATTNNRMELTAAIQALEALNQPCAVTLYTDSEYLQKGITGWLPGWVRRGWKTANGQPVKNRELWERLHAATARHDIDWRWMRGHDGNLENERAHQLATVARENAAKGGRPVDQ